MRHNIYLGIDGVVLTKGVQPALHLDRFLKYVLAHYSVSWLSSRCHGNSRDTTQYLSQFLAPKTITMIEKISPTSFRLDKTEAIDFSTAFFWLDDQLFDSEKNTLRKHGEYDSWIQLDLINNPDQLLYLLSSKLVVKRDTYTRPKSLGI